MSLLKFSYYAPKVLGIRIDANNDLQGDLKIFKRDTFENYKSFVPVEVQSQNKYILNQTLFVILPKCALTLINRFYNLGTYYNSKKVHNLTEMAAGFIRQERWVWDYVADAIYNSAMLASCGDLTSG